MNFVEYIYHRLPTISQFPQIVNSNIRFNLYASTFKFKHKKISIPLHLTSKLRVNLIMSIIDRLLIIRISIKIINFLRIFLVTTIETYL